MGKYRIRKLDIEGFRIYSRRQTVNVYSNLTVVYGKNGRGKTTLQDAVGWLFNDNINRYSSYRSEWNRAKKTHIRSLINPEIETKITGYFEDILSEKMYVVTRDESKLIGSENLKNSLFSTSKRREDLLWANSLSQSKLQELAIANGRDRLENLAPLLDLTEIDNQVKEVDEHLKECKFKLKDLSNKKKNLNRYDRYELYNKFKLKTEKIQSKLTQFVELPLEPKNDFSNSKEIDEWKKWLNKTLENVTDKNVEINKFLKESSEQEISPMMENSINQNYDTLQGLEKQLNNIKSKETIHKDRVKQLNKDIKTIDNEMKNINDLFHYLKETNLKLVEKEKEINKLEKVMNKHLSLEEDLASYQKDINVILNQKEIFEDNLNNSKKKRGVINTYYSDYIKQVENIKEYSDKVTKLEEWLTLNSNTQSQMLIDELEMELTNYDTKYSSIYDEQKELEKVYDVFIEKVTNQECPLCGIEHNSEENLIESINQQKKSRVKNLLELNNNFIKIKEKISDIKNLNIVRHEKEKVLHETRILLKNERENLKQNTQETEEKARFYNIKVDKITESLFLTLLKTNEKEYLLLSKEIYELENKYQNTLKKHNELSETIKSEKKLYHDAVREKDMLSNEEIIIMNRIKERLSLYKYDNQIEETFISEFLSKLQDEIIQEVKEIKSITFVKERRMLQTEIYRNYIQRQKEIIEVYKEIENVQEYLIIMEENIQSLKESEKLNYRVNGLKQEIKKLNVNRNNLREKQRLETNKEIGKMASRISMIFEILSDTSPWRTIKSDAVVPGSRERTNLVFRPIPHKYEKNQKEYIRKTQSNSTFAFSGGQLSLLGLSIFLSQVADAHSNNKELLDTIILDDPIQMLDTLRDDALISLICDIAQEKQIIISTSDINFANKLILASRPIWENKSGSCGILHFDKLEEDGPIIEEISPKNWIINQRIYLPKLNKASSL